MTRCNSDMVIISNLSESSKHTKEKDISLGKFIRILKSEVKYPSGEDLLVKLPQFNTSAIKLAKKGLQSIGAKRNLSLWSTRYSSRSRIVRIVQSVSNGVLIERIIHAKGE